MYVFFSNLIYNRYYMSNSMQSHAPAPGMGAIQNTDRNNMNGDDSNIVDEILNELNDNQNRDNGPQEQAPQQPTIPPQMQMEQPQQQMQAQMEHPMHMEQEMEDPTQHMEMPPEVLNVEYNNNESKLESILNKLKKPIIITCLAFILFNPLVMNLLATYVPRVFGATDNLVMRQVRTLILALAIGVIFFGINLVM